MSNSSDRRPWLILSRREGQALLYALNALEGTTSLTPDMRTAREQIQKQLAWINGHTDVEEPTKDAAVEREHEANAHDWAMSNAMAEERAQS